MRAARTLTTSVASDVACTVVEDPEGGHDRSYCEVKSSVPRRVRLFQARRSAWCAGRAGDQIYGGVRNGRVPPQRVRGVMPEHGGDDDGRRHLRGLREQRGRYQSIDELMMEKKCICSDFCGEL
eukprot:995758-Heterocapsa_arctica.AAC.1